MSKRVQERTHSVPGQLMGNELLFGCESAPLAAHGIYSEIPSILSVVYDYGVLRIRSMVLSNHIDSVNVLAGAV